MIAILISTTVITPSVEAATKYVPYYYYPNFADLFDTMPAMARNDSLIYSLGCEDSKCDNTYNGGTEDPREGDAPIAYLTLSDDGVAYDRFGNALPPLADNVRIISLAPMAEAYGKYSPYSPILSALGSDGNVYTMSPDYTTVNGKLVWPEWKKIISGTNFKKIVGVTEGTPLIFGLTNDGKVVKLYYSDNFFGDSKLKTEDVSDSHTFKDIAIYYDVCNGSGTGWGSEGCSGGDLQYTGLTTDNKIYLGGDHKEFDIPQKAKELAPNAYLTETGKVVKYGFTSYNSQIVTESTKFYAKHLGYGIVESTSSASSSSGSVTITYRSSLTFFSGSTRPIVDTNTLKFNLNGPTGPAPKNQVLSATQKTTEPPAPSWDGHSFLGWYTKDVGGTKFVFGKTLPRDTTVYAHWSGMTSMPSTGSESDIPLLASITLLCMGISISKHRSQIGE